MARLQRVGRPAGVGMAWNVSVLALDEPLVFSKRWLFWAEWPDAKLLLDPDLDKFIMERRPAGRVLNDVLARVVTR